MSFESDSPILSKKIRNYPITYLDSAASTQKPNSVIESLTNFYENSYENVHRGMNSLSISATDQFERTRESVKDFINAKSSKEVIFTRGATDSINIIANSLIKKFQDGGQVVITELEHHSNYLPWMKICDNSNLELKIVPVNENGIIDEQQIIDICSDTTKILAITHMSNVLGTVVDVKTICHEARKRGIVSLVDGSQAAVHMSVNVKDIGCDFYAITGHKLCGPSGSGAIYIKQEIQKTMRPFIGGGDMIKDVFTDKVIYNDPPMKFEAGTPGIVQTIGFGVALEYMMSIGMDNIEMYESELTLYARQKLEGLNWLNIQGKPSKKGAIFAFTLEGSAHAHDISTILDKQGIAVRAGQHCAGPLMHHMGINASCRASFAFYNTKQEVDKLLSGLELARDLLS